MKLIIKSRESTEINLTDTQCKYIVCKFIRENIFDANSKPKTQLQITGAKFLCLLEKED